MPAPTVGPELDQRIGQRIMGGQAQALAIGSARRHVQVPPIMYGPDCMAIGWH
jgi:hypothetical protein